MTNRMNPAWNRARILIVDDELPVRLALQAILAEEYEVALAEDAVQAERVLASMSVQVVVTDFNLPGRSGTDLISSILDQFPEVVVILLTGYTSKPAVRTAGKDRKVFAVLTKPYDPASFLRSLRMAVATSHLLTLRHTAPAGRPSASAACAQPLPSQSSQSPRRVEAQTPLSHQRK